MASKIEREISVMVIDDQASIRDAIRRHLSHQGYCVRAFSSGVEAMKALPETPTDIVITDLEMPELSGTEVLHHVRIASPQTEVIIVTAHADKEVAINALRLGAFDFFEKPLSLIQLSETLKRTVNYQQALRERDRLADHVSFLTEREREQWGEKAFVGRSPAIRKLMRQVKRIKDVMSSVLIVGESGTGKELVARAIHYSGPRADKPFIAVNCSAVPADLVESQLFGHSKGSFTGATNDHRGFFALADGGTLFLDEIGDMPTEMQTKLLRVLEDNIVQPIGAAKALHVDVRVLAATNANLQQKLSDGTFRTDLFFRLDTYGLDLPPLRDRRGDIPLLAEHFVKTISVEMGMPPPTMHPDVVKILSSHPFPGNVRELRNVIERSLIDCDDAQIKPCDIHFKGFPNTAGCALGAVNAPDPESGVENLPLNLKEAEGILVKRSMQIADGNMSEAARLLGINRSKLYRLCAA
jgi:DNA-binding NtrC family response regulator